MLRNNDLMPWGCLIYPSHLQCNRSFIVYRNTALLDGDMTFYTVGYRLQQWKGTLLSVNVYLQADTAHLLLAPIASAIVDFVGIATAVCAESIVTPIKEV